MFIGTFSRESQVELTEDPVGEAVNALTGLVDMVENCWTLPVDAELGFARLEVNAGSIANWKLLPSRALTAIDAGIVEKMRGPDTASPSDTKVL